MNGVVRFQTAHLHVECHHRQRLASLGTGKDIAAIVNLWSICQDIRNDLHGTR